MRPFVMCLSLVRMRYQTSPSAAGSPSTSGMWSRAQVNEQIFEDCLGLVGKAGLWQASELAGAQRPVCTPHLSGTDVEKEFVELVRRIVGDPLECNRSVGSRCNIGCT